MEEVTGMGAQQRAATGAAAATAEMSPSLEQLWLNYKHKQDEEARQELINRHLHLVKYIASRMVVHLPPMVELDDLISYGVFGLLDAIEKFDYRRGVKFETYAYTRIKGAVLDGLRAMDWLPQSLRKQAKEVEAAYWQLYHQDGRPPSDDQVAQSLGLSSEEYGQLSQRLSSTTILSLEDVLGSGDDGDGSISLRDLLADPESPDPLAAVQLSEAKERLAAAIAALPERDQLIISLYYYEGLTVKEIAEIMDLSASRISQIHTRAVMRLRAHMQAGQAGA